MRQLFNTIACTIVALIFGAGTQQTPSKYLVTGDPIRVHAGPAGLCVAINPVDPTGIWWWGPGRSGCTSRNTETHENAKGIEALFHAPDAAVSRDPSGTVHARFRLGLHARPGEPDYLDIDLSERDGVIRCASTQASVKAKRLDRLDIPLDLAR